eukprot:385542-Prorocentrum_minimum.AAC.1
MIETARPLHSMTKPSGGNSWRRMTKRTGHAGLEHSLYFAKVCSGQDARLGSFGPMDNVAR